MPVAVSGLIAATLGSSAVGVALQSALGALTILGGTALGGALINLGLSVGLNFLAQSLFRPSAPKPEDVQTSFRQATAPRVRHYGRIKASGPWVFAASSAGNFYKVIALGQGPIDGIEEFWLDDNLVTFDAGGEIQQGTWISGSSPLVRVQYRLGQAVETAYGALSGTFPQWTADHRGDGVASLFITQRAVGSDYFLSLFPNGINTSYRVVMRGAKLVPIGGGALEWGDNAASVIYDYMGHQDGLRLPSAVLDTPLALSGWATAFSRADEAIALAAGGTEPRYRLWGSYQLSERPADVLGRMLQSCDGRLVPTPDGGLTLDIGTWEEPTVVIGPETITGFSELGRGRDVLSTANTIRATYLEPAQDYQAADADPWVDEADVSERGEISSDVQFHMAPSHGQARRLMKLAAYRANPNWVGTFQCNLRALAAIGKRFVRIQYPLFGINSVFEVQDLRFIIGEGGILTGVTLQMQSMPAASSQWDSSQEGTAPVMDEADSEDGVPTPAPPTVDFVGDDAELSFSPSPSVLLSYQARYKPTASSDWFTITGLPQDATGLVIESLAADTAYEFQLRWVTEKGRPGNWSASTIATTPV
jgi:hypothetical protein